jgi:uroporphyrinogen-III synthase
MSRPLLVLRPEPGNAATVQAARALGLTAIAAPLFTVRPIEWSLGDAIPEALLMTSANAARHGGATLRQLFRLPVYAVGQATADVAQDAGFTDIRVGSGNVDAVLTLAQGDGARALLHLVGREHRPAVAEGIAIERRIVYASDPADRLPEVVRDALPGVVSLLHSARAARLFAGLVDPAGIRIAAISAATLAAAGDGWRDTAVARAPTDASLLAVAAKLCDQGGRRGVNG